MATQRPISARWRAVGPIALAGALVGRRAPSAAQSTDPEGREQDALTSLLALVPASAAGGPENQQIGMFANLAAQLASGDIALPASIEDEVGLDPWLHAISSLAIADPFRSFAKTLTRAFLGFDLTDVDQTLEIGEPPLMVTLLRGRFDQEAVAAAWQANGYRILEVEGVRVASLFEDQQLDLRNEVSRIFLARANNAAFLSDGTLAYASRLDLLTSVIATAAGSGEDSLAADEEMAALLRSLEAPLASAIFFSGEALRYLPEFDPRADEETIEAIASAIAAPNPMPPIALGLVGVNPGGPTVMSLETGEPMVDLPPATIVYRVLMAEQGTAETAAEIADGRLRTMSSVRTNQPYRDLFASWEARAAENGSVLALDLQPAEGATIDSWHELLWSRDVLFLAW